MLHVFIGVGNGEFAKNGSIKNREVQELLDLSSQGSYSYIQKLLEKGLIKSQGKGRSTAYVLK